MPVIPEIVKSQLHSLSSVSLEEFMTVPTVRVCSNSIFFAFGLGVLINSIYIDSLIS